MDEFNPNGIEAKRWTVVFHRKSGNWFFRTIAMGHFKHVSAFAWLPDIGRWLIYDVGFRRTRLAIYGDDDEARKYLAALVTGNRTVTIDVREDNLPFMRIGMFCTTAVAHLIGIRSSALRPDRLYRHLIAQGGSVSEYESGQAATGDRPEFAG